MYLFSAQMKQPVYYRLINGNITDVKSMSLCLKEMNLKDNVVFIADKGFFSAKNIDRPEDEKLHYIIPLHRNNPLIDYSPLEQNNFKKEMRYFIFQGRIIRYYSCQKEDYRLITFLDEALRVSEERDYLSRIETHPESYIKTKFDEKYHSFGTLTMVYKMKKQEEGIENKQNRSGQMKKTKKEIPIEQIVYESYKQRNEIEIMFDSYKNYLDGDVSYMQNRYVMEGWRFANFIAMIAYYKLYVRLRQAKLLPNNSPKDIIEQSKAICQIRIRSEWHPAKMTEKTRKLFAKIGIDYCHVNIVKS